MTLRLAAHLVTMVMLNSAEVNQRVMNDGKASNSIFDVQSWVRKLCAGTLSESLNQRTTTAIASTSTTVAVKWTHKEGLIKL